MDPRLNPYAPGAGTPPPELAGRDDIIERASISLGRIRKSRAARGMILYGLRGVGKTVLLNRIRRDAEASGSISVWIEAPEGRSLPAALIPALRSAIIKMSVAANLRDRGARALNVLHGFASAMKLSFSDIELGIIPPGEPGTADSGDLEADLVDLIKVVGELALAKESAVAILIDELQYVPEAQLAALITSLHRASQDQLPVTLMAAGLPQLLGQMGRAKSYAERLFEFVPIDKLGPTEAREALCVPAERHNVVFNEDAIVEIIVQTQGFPYFLQEWGKHSWDIATSSPITHDDAAIATTLALEELDSSFFRVRFDRLTPLEKKYMRAMAELGPGPHRSGDIAHVLGREVTAVAPTRNSLIGKGMIYSPAHGDTAFTVPLFDGFMKRIMP
jgi:hypothetical protein